MSEELFYATLPEREDRTFLVHAHYAEGFTGEAFLFLNPILDEKKRVQRFQAETARALCKMHHHVFRFDYFGTGDSGGELFEFDLSATLADLVHLTGFLTGKYQLKVLHLLGVRLGADLAALLAARVPSAGAVFLVEPVVKGRRYLVEQRLRRKSFYQLNHMSPEPGPIQIGGKPYEDHQGYPLSEAVVQFLEALQTDQAGITDRDLFVFRMHATSSRKTVQQLTGALAARNRVAYQEVSGTDFWASLETVDTSALTNAIVNQVTP